MSAAALVAVLDAAGIYVSRAGDNLRVRAQPGVSLAPSAEDLRQHKQALLAELRLREEIVAAASVSHARFDRARYDELWRRWSERQEENA